MIRAMTALCLAALAVLVGIVVWGVGSLVASVVPIWAIFHWTMFAIGCGVVLCLGAALVIDGWVR